MSTKISILLNNGIPRTVINNQTSTISEPSVSELNGKILISGNWYAAESVDGGHNWNYISPYISFPNIISNFCCDQTIISDNNRKQLIWLLQYSRHVSQATGNIANVLRLSIRNNGNQSFDYYDLIPEDVDSNWQNEWFDYNHAVVTNDYLYIGTNVFDNNSNFTRSVIFRIGLEELNNSSLSYEYFETSQYGSLRCVQGANDVMYIGTHSSSNRKNTIKIFAWDEKTNDLNEYEIPISSFNSNDYYSQCPDNTLWLGSGIGGRYRCDRRITGAWIADGIIGFMWTAGRDASNPQPYIRVVRINESDMRLIDEPDIRNSNYAFSYPEVAPNDKGDLGVTMFLGGGTKYPSHVIGFWNQENSGWELYVASQGTHGPNQSKWGDYLCCRVSEDGNSWLASGAILTGGGDHLHVEPRIVKFKIEDDAILV